VQQNAQNAVTFYSHPFNEMFISNCKYHPLTTGLLTSTLNCW